MNIIELSHPTKIIHGSVLLSGSKSVSNRVLIIKALSGKKFTIQNLSPSDDTQLLSQLLDSQDEVWDCHHAGTTFRFLTAFLAVRPGTQILTGSERMKNRPIKDLVDALRQLGADIEYLENPGYPPLKIHSPSFKDHNHIRISASVSSQFISALLLISPTLPGGMVIEMEGTVVSRPYIDMTIDIMAYFGVHVKESNHTFRITQQKYQNREFFVEGDWSAASYFYIIAGLSKKSDIQIGGLFEESLQGDKEIVHIGEKMGIKTDFHQQGLTIVKNEDVKSTPLLEQDFLKVPDLAQSVSVMCAGTGTHGLFSGLQTLRLKETDRITAVRTELQKVGVSFFKIPEKFAKKSNKEFYLMEGNAAHYTGDTPTFNTYEDHRMAMSFAPLALLYPIRIHHPEVVSKSYPSFWDNLAALGFKITYV